MLSAHRTGQWGISSPAVNTAGASDTTCVGLTSLSQTKAEIQSEAASAPPKATSHTAAIALGLVCGLLVPLVLAGIGFWWWRRRKRLMLPIMVGALDSKPRPFDPGMQEQALGRPSLNLDTNVMHVNSQSHRSPSWVVDIRNASTGLTNDSPTSTDMQSSDLHQNFVPTPFLTSSQVARSGASLMVRSPQSMLPPLALTRTISTTQSPRLPTSPPEPMPTMALVTTPNSTSPAVMLSPTQRYRKALEAHAEAQAARARMTPGSSSASGSGSGFGSAPLSASQSMFAAGTSFVRSIPQRSQSAIPRSSYQQPAPRRAGSSLRLPPAAAFREVGPDIIIQHQDGGMVEELPPPYPTDARYPAPRIPPFPRFPPPITVRGEAEPST